MGIASTGTNATGSAEERGGATDHGWTFGDTARSIAHLIGILAGIALLYSAYSTGRKASGGAVGATAKYVIVGTVTFLLAVFAMEVDHVFGVHVWYFITAEHIDRMWHMMLLATTITMYALGYRKLVMQVRGEGGG
ncbi:MAG: hypothetical protein SVU32_08670 [Candidatus Nanohaloarchaea archaeon]|nr:hypothetical protein [Candidatus Nanohaloarchaea archaeon]